METGIGEYFRVKFHTNFPLHLRYDFDWQSLKGTPHPFQEFDYGPNLIIFRWRTSVP